MNPIQESAREQVSALADGALRGDELVHAVQALCADESLQQAWRDYHAVGDVLVAGTRQPCTGSAAFLGRFQQRLAAEATARPLQAAVAPEASVAHVSASLEPVESIVVPLPVKVTRLEAANEPVFRWKLVAGVASLAAVAAIGWNLVGSATLPSAGAQLALQQSQPLESREISPAIAASVPQAGGVQLAGLQSAGPTLATTESLPPQTMLRDPRLDQLLEAHRQAGGAAQMPSGFLRNATFDVPSR
jgi:sigma-E factor negative regulatory protein RseA